MAEITNDSNQTPVTSRTPPDHIGVLIAGVLMMLGGWYGLYQVVTTTLPRVGPRWTFFVLLHIAVTGTVMPFIRFFNVRLKSSSHSVPPGAVIVRQSIWVGLFVVTCAWLQIPRVLSWPIAFFVALIFIVIEIFLRTREIPHERERE